MNKQHLYHQEVLNDWYYSEVDWKKTDDVQFADVSDFDRSEIAFSILPDDLFHSIGENISKQSVN